MDQLLRLVHVHIEMYDCIIQCPEMQTIRACYEANSGNFNIMSRNIFLALYNCGVKQVT